ncbi:MAG: hypothetical protein HZB51_04835 [Chloroflexi bacterium]|nr:hypothetical protein [Chloroflexota bacterium]
MKSKLGVYIITFGGFDAVDYFKRAQPRIALSMDHNADMWRQLKQVSPNTFVIGRHYVDDGEQIFIDNPESRAEQFFQRMKPDAEKMRGIYDAWMGYNESVVQSNEAAQALSRFHVRWGDLMRDAKLVSCAYSFATGNPELEYWPALAEGLRHCDLLSLHEYSARTMEQNSSWLCLRYRRAIDALPPDARKQVVITETGIDGGVLPDPNDAQQGWTFYTDEAGYVATLSWYDKEMQKDDYVIGAAIFATSPWGKRGSFGIANANQIRDYMAQGGAPAPVVINAIADPAASAAIAAAKKLKLMPINTDGALYKFAEEQNLGYPQTDEFEFTSGGATYVGQVYNLGIVFVKKGDWGNVLWMKKPT